MAQKIGFTTEEARDAFGGRSEELNVGNLKLNQEFHVRIVGGVKKIERCWYPYLILNDKQEWVTTWMAPIVGEDSILEALAAIDQKIAVEKTHKPPSECKSRVAPAGQWLYTCFDRDDQKVALKKLVCNWSTGNGIQELQEKEKRGKDGFLEHGLIFMFDLWIQKKLKDKTKGDTWTNIEYAVEAIGSDLNPFTGKIPVSATKAGDPVRKALIDNLEKLNPPVFTPEELQAIKESKLDLEAEGRALSDDEVMAMLIEKPVFLRAIGQRNQPVFQYPEELAVEAKRLGIPFVMEVKDMIAYKLAQAEAKDGESAPPPETHEHHEPSTSANPTDVLADLTKPAAEAKSDSAKEKPQTADQSVPLSELLPGVDIKLD